MERVDKDPATVTVTTWWKKDRREVGATKSVVSSSAMLLCTDVGPRPHALACRETNAPTAGVAAPPMESTIQDEKESFMMILGLERK